MISCPEQGERGQSEQVTGGREEHGAREWPEIMAGVLAGRLAGSLRASRDRRAG
jgi:hypothetical protein